MGSLDESIWMEVCIHASAHLHTRAYRCEGSDAGQAALTDNNKKKSGGGSCLMYVTQL